jgi:hypothetical protein
LIILGILAGIPVVALGALLPVPLGPALLAMGFAFPALLLQDGWRSALFTAGRARSAFAVDLVNAVVLIPAIALSGSLPLSQPSGAILLWGLSTVASTAVGIRVSGTRPAPGRALAWLREHRDLGPRYAAESGVGLLASQGAIYVVGAVAGLAAAGSIRGAQLLLGPLHVLVQAAYLAAVPEGVRLRASYPQRFVPGLIAISVALAFVTLAWTAALIALPQGLGEQLLGPSWNRAHLVLVPLALALAGQSLAAGSIVGLRVLANARSSLRARLVDAPVGFALATIGALWAGAAGAAWGFAASGLFGAIVFTIAFKRAMSSAAAGPSVTADVSRPRRAGPGGDARGDRPRTAR